MTLSRKGAKSRTGVPGLRSTGTKATTNVDRLSASNAEPEKKLAEALEQQAATSEVLRIISSSPGDLRPVFEAILSSATRLCEAKFGVLFRSEGDALRAVALHNAPAAFAEERRRNPVLRPNPGTGLGRVASTKQTVQIADAQAEPAYHADPARAAFLHLAGARTFLTVPMLKEGELVGAIAIYRQEVRPFTDRQIELVSNFANQAVIAIENTRLLNELRQRTDDLSEALEQQTATSEVLQVISSSPGELEPVFNTVLQNATQICDAFLGSMVLREGDAYRIVAQHGGSPAYAEQRRREPVVKRGPGTMLDQIARTKQPMHVADVAAVEQLAPALAKLAGARTLLMVPMLKDNEMIGAVGIYRQEVRPFSDKQIELLSNFAKQAVIAIENTRLLNELRDRLQQQTATADVLKVISRSTFDLQAVLDTLVESAGHLCRADRVAIRLARDGLYHNVASYGFPTKHVAYMRSHPVAADRTSIVGRVVLAGKSVHIPDADADPELTLLQARGVEKNPHCAGRAAAARREAHRRPGGDAAQR